MREGFAVQYTPAGRKTICIGLRLTMIFLMSRNMPGRATSGIFSARSSCIKISSRCDSSCRSTRRVSVRCAAGRQGILLCKIFSGRAQNVHARFGFIRGFLPRLKGAAECIRLLHTGAFARHGGCAAAGTGWISAWAASGTSAVCPASFAPRRKASASRLDEPFRFGLPSKTTIFIKLSPFRFLPHRCPLG